MTQAVNVNEFSPFTDGYGYGWAGMDQKTLARKLTRAAAGIVKLRTTLGFDAIAFSGSSGSAIAFHTAIIAGIPLIYVRKDGEHSHGCRVESNVSPKVHIARYLIVDDFVDSGTTVRHIVDEISMHCYDSHAYPAVPVGVYCFDKPPELVAYNSRVTLTGTEPSFLRIYGARK